MVEECLSGMLTIYKGADEVYVESPDFILYAKQFAASINFFGIFGFFIEFSILRVGTAQCSGIPIKTNANYLGRLDAYTASVAALQPTYSDDRP